jgi:hypothetical protein
LSKYIISMDKICPLITRWGNFVQMYDILEWGNIPLCIYLKYGGMDINGQKGLCIYIVKSCKCTNNISNDLWYA